MAILLILFTLIIWALIFWLLWWGVGAIGFPEPFVKPINTVLVIASVVIIIGIFTGYIHPFPFLQLR